MVVTSALLTVVVTAVGELVLPLAVGGRTGTMSRLVMLELAPLTILGAATGTFGAMLAVRRIFVPTVFVMAIEPALKTVLTLAFGHAIGINALIIGNVAGSATAAGVLYWRVGRLGVHVRLQSAFYTPFVRGVLRLTVPLLASASVLQVNPAVDRTMAGVLGAGSVTALELWLRLSLVPALLATSLLISPITATWAERRLAEGWPALRQSLARAIVAVATLVPPLVVLGFVLRRDIVSFVYQGGAYSPHALRQTTSVFGMMVLSLPAEVLIVVLATLFIIEKDTVFPMMIGFTNVVLNTVLNFALRPSLGVAGIALSTTVTVTILAGVYSVVAQRRWQAFALTETVPDMGTAAISTAVVGGLAFGLIRLLPSATSRLGALLTIVLVGSTGLALHALVLFARRRSAFSVVRDIRTKVGAQA